MLDLRDSSPAWGRPVLVEGVIGPRGDGYVASARMTWSQAEAYHTPQLEALAAGGADLESALTITYVDEAIGIAGAAERVGLPIAVSFTVEIDGRLPQRPVARREPLERVDEETDGAAYCAARSTGSPLVERLGFVELGVAAHGRVRTHSAVRAATGRRRGARRRSGSDARSRS